MAIRRALVVDDSKSARISLQRMLEDHGLRVDLAESGEQALDFLRKEKVDVVFMDHTMPGMDGLEAVALIKANPQTATIPVMMYTTKEGEVYVGQARALGAVGVMPKNVEKHQVFEMLLKLGLVQDRRAPREEAAETARRIEESLVDQQLSEQALGISVQSLVSRMLQDQHLTLRSDILRSQKVFAKEVAREVLKEHLSLLDQEGEAAEPMIPAAEAQRFFSPRLITGLVVVALVVAGFLAFQFKSQRDAALARVQVLRQSATVPDNDNGGARVDEAQLQQVRDETERLRAAALSGLAWSANEGNFVDVGAPAFSSRLAGKIREFVAQLELLGFVGEVRLTSHLGRFCLATDGGGSYRLADAERDVTECDYLGHPLDGSTYVSDRLSLDFSDLLGNDPAPGIRLTLIALDEDQSAPAVDYPASGASAGEWNTAALLNNRVEVELVAESGR